MNEVKNEEIKYITNKWYYITNECINIKILSRRDEKRDERSEERKIKKAVRRKKKMNE